MLRRDQISLKVIFASIKFRETQKVHFNNFFVPKRQKEEKIRNVKKSKIEALTFSFSISGFLKPFDISCLCYVG